MSWDTAVSVRNARSETAGREAKCPLPAGSSSAGRVDHEGVSRGGALGSIRDARSVVTSYVVVACASEPETYICIETLR